MFIRRTEAIAYDSSLSKPQIRLRGKVELEENTSRFQQNKETQKEVCSNGMELELSDKKIVGVKLPNGVRVNMARGSIQWDDFTHWYTDAENFNVLQTSKSKFITDKGFMVTEYLEKNHEVPFYSTDNLLVDGRHHVLINARGLLSAFKFKSDDGQVVQTYFEHTKDGKDLISFVDGTVIEMMGKEINITHNGKKLTYDNRQEFAETYDGKQISAQQIIKNGVQR